MRKTKLRKKLKVKVVLTMKIIKEKVRSMILKIMERKLNLKDLISHRMKMRMSASKWRAGSW